MLHQGWTDKVFPQVSTSFLTPLEANGDYKKSKLLFDHFLDGTDKDLSKSDKESLDLMISKVKSYYQWDDVASTFHDLATQNCSEMLVYASNAKTINTFQDQEILVNTSNEKTKNYFSRPISMAYIYGCRGKCN